MDASPLKLDRFARCLVQLGRSREIAAEEFLRLQAGYAGAGRAYHNAWHIADCLAQLDLARDLAEQPAEVEAAIWFHDVVYNPRAKDNEAQSAAWAQRTLTSAGVAALVRDRIEALILATQHAHPPESRDAELLVDIDLSILGRDEAAFDAYDRQIYLEYAWVPAEQYLAGRQAVLEAFLRRAAIYSTESFRQRYEAAARSNLTRAIARLEQRRGG